MKRITKGLVASLVGSAVAATGLLASATAPANAADATISVVTVNTDFAKGGDAQDWNYLKNTNADIVLFQEVKNVNLRSFIGADWAVVQDTSSDDRQGSGVAVRLSSVQSVDPQALALGTTVNSSCTHDPIQARWIASANVVLKNGAKLRVASLHMPPDRCFGASYDDMAQHVVGYANGVGAGRTTILGADWNKNVNADPNNIAASTNLKPNGIGIDGFMTSRGRGLSITGGPVQLDPINSDHRPVRITLSVPSQ